MYLKNFNQMTKCCVFDRVEGIGLGFQCVGDTKTSGFCVKGDFGWVAVYPENDSLVVQINGQKWDLMNGDVEVDYFHIYDEKMTTFKISVDGKEFEYTYKSWWAERDDFEVNPIAASCEEENAEEDIFGYIKMLKDNEDSARGLIKLWSNNLGA